MPAVSKKDIPFDPMDADEKFARFILGMPDQVAIGYLEAWHSDTCDCGAHEQEGPTMLKYMKQQWAGKR